MAIKCWVGCHKWEGCKCSACGKTRDEGHDWASNCEACSRCGEVRAPSHSWEGCKCSICGTERNDGDDWGGDRETCSQCGKTPAEVHDVHLLSDTPVTQPEDDRLGRTPFAERLAQALLDVESTDGFVFGIHGEWGSGKTSILNLVTHFVEARLEGSSDKFIVVHFNPWWYGTDDDLLLRLLTAMSEAVGRYDSSEGLKKLGTILVRLGSALSPLRYVPGIAEVSGAASNALSAAGAATGGLAASLSKDANKIREEVIGLLAQGDCRLLIVVDDIDRLTPAEISRLFRVIKAVANFPKTVYLLAFDKAVVAEALKAQMHVDGEAYIEKVVQAAADLPLPDAISLHNLLTQDLDRLLETWSPENWEAERWLNTYVDGIKPLVKTPRDVKRYVNAVRLTCGKSLRAELNPVDAFAIEAIRTFAPATYSLVRDNPDVFAGGTESGPVLPEQREHKERVATAAIEAVPEGWARPHVSRILCQLFPKFAAATQRGSMNYGVNWEIHWRRSQRICAPDVFPVYFQLAVPEAGVSRGLMNRLLALASSPGELADELRQLAVANPPASRRFIRTVLHRLQDHTEEDIRTEDILTVLKAIFDIADELIASDLPRNMYEYDVEMSVLRITYQLSMRLEYQTRYDFLLKAVRNSRSPFAAIHEVTTAEQHWEDADKGEVWGEPTVLREDLDRLRQAAVERIRVAVEDGALLAWPRLSRVMRAWQRWEGDASIRDWLKGTVASDAGLVTLLIAVLSMGSAQTMGSFYSRPIWYSDRKFIEELSGNAEELVGRVEALLNTLPEDADDAIGRALQAYVDDGKPDRMR